MSSVPLSSLAHLRTMIVFAHADDESIGLGGSLPGWSEVWFVCVTNNSPPDLADAWRAGCATRDDYARLREQELRHAISDAGHNAARLVLLGFGDQEASSHLFEIADALEVLLREIRPALVVTHPYEGGHPDHDATAFAVHCALARQHRHSARSPQRVEMTSYHWRDGTMVWGDFLPGTGDAGLTIPLDAEAQETKARLLADHASQAAMLSAVPLAHERLRIAPDYDFTRAPHEGRLFYEHFSWGTNGRQWRERAMAALKRLDLVEEGPTCR